MKCNKCEQEIVCDECGQEIENEMPKRMPKLMPGMFVKSKDEGWGVIIKNDDHDIVIVWQNGDWGINARVYSIEKICYAFSFNLAESENTLVWERN